MSRYPQSSLDPQRSIQFATCFSLLLTQPYDKENNKPMHKNTNLAPAPTCSPHHLDRSSLRFAQYLLLGPTSISVATACCPGCPCTSSVL